MNDDIMGALSVDKGTESIIMVAGIGGAGGNAVKYMHEQGINGVEFMVCNTDQQALDNSPIESKIRLGSEGLGAGNNPEDGRKAATESLDAIKSHLKASSTKMIFITAGMGGGTGTGASPVIAKMAKEEGILTVAIVTSPLTLEGNLRYKQAKEGIEKLRGFVDTLLVINNDNIINQYEDLSVSDAFQMADNILCSAAKGIAEIITVKSELVNVDFADVKRVMTDSGTAHMSVASAEGENRAQEVVEASLTSPLLDKNLISGAKNILVNFVTEGPKGLKTKELNTILSYIQSKASRKDANGEMQTANIIWGTSARPGLGSKLELVVVATGFKDELMEAKKAEAEEVEKPSEVVEVAQESVVEVVEERVVEAPKQPEETRPVEVTSPKQVVLGNRKSSYSDLINKITMEPAYKTRHVEMITSTSSNNRKEVLKESDADAEAKNAKDVSLF